RLGAAGPRPPRAQGQSPFAAGCAPATRAFPGLRTLPAGQRLARPARAATGGLGRPLNANAPPPARGAAPAASPGSAHGNARAAPVGPPGGGKTAAGYALRRLVAGQPDRHCTSDTAWTFLFAPDRTHTGHLATRRFPAMIAA